MTFKAFQRQRVVTETKLSALPTSNRAESIRAKSARADQVSCRATFCTFETDCYGGEDTLVGTRGPPITIYWTLRSYWRWWAQLLRGNKISSILLVSTFYSTFASAERRKIQFLWLLSVLTVARLELIVKNIVLQIGNPYLSSIFHN